MKSVSPGSERGSIINTRTGVPRPSNSSRVSTRQVAVVSYGVSGNSRTSPIGRNADKNQQTAQNIKVFLIHFALIAVRIGVYSREESTTATPDKKLRPIRTGTEKPHRSARDTSVSLDAAETQTDTHNRTLDTRRTVTLDARNPNDTALDIEETPAKLDKDTNPLDAALIEKCQLL